MSSGCGTQQGQLYLILPLPSSIPALYLIKGKIKGVIINYFCSLMSKVGDSRHVDPLCCSEFSVPIFITSWIHPP
jgi:hypothetical protein